MRGGEILVHGDAGEEAGAGLRRGLIAVGGRAGAAAGLRALAGTIVALGGFGAQPGHGHAPRAASSPCGAAAAADLRVRGPRATARRSCACTCGGLRALGLPVDATTQIDGRYARWSGDGARARPR